MDKITHHRQPAPAPASAPALFRLERAILRVEHRRLLPGTTWTLRRGQNWVIMGNHKKQPQAGPARAMVKQPTLLVLDEPCQGLDPHNRMRLLDMLAAIVTTGPTQLIYVSHRLDEIPVSTTHELHLGGDGNCGIRSR
ncbi:MAG: hypothetical protein JJV98_17300 [Desulfosarcina sp.]|nr:hypothetical protein [Desulfobacterales bacterium]